MVICSLSRFHINPSSIIICRLVFRDSDKLSHTFSRLYHSLYFCFLARQLLSRWCLDDNAHKFARSRYPFSRRYTMKLILPHSFKHVVIESMVSIVRVEEVRQGAIHYTHKYRNKLFSFGQLAHSASSNNGSASQRDPSCSDDEDEGARKSSTHKNGLHSNGKKSDSLDAKDD